VKPALGLAVLATVVLVWVTNGFSATNAVAASPKLRAQDRQQIGALIDRFVKEAVRRENLPAAWSLLGPQLRGGTTKAAWDAGTEVTVENYPARGDDFRTAWTSAVIKPGDVDVALMLHPESGHPDIPQTAFKAEVIKSNGRWIVDSFYPAATFSAGGSVQGPADYGAPGGGKAIGNDNAKIRPLWFILGVSVLGALIVLLPIGLWVRARRRDRRAYATYAAVTKR
jgi:hypothetical protein